MSLTTDCWRPISSVPVGIVIETKINDARGVRNECKLIYEKDHFWDVERKGYIYYVPTHWRHPRE